MLENIVTPESISTSCAELIANSAYCSTFTVKNKSVCEIKQGSDKASFVPICDPFEVLGRSYNEYGENSGIIIRFAADRIKRDIVEANVSVSDLISDGRKVIADLAGKGLWVAGRKDAVAKAAELLAGIRPLNDVVTLSRPGWHGDVFAAPTGRVFGAHDATYRLVASATYDDPAPSGDLNGWQVSTEAALRSPNGDFLCMGVLSGFAGCLVNLMKQPTSILLNFAGTTSRGKTTAQRLGASVWGNPVRGAALVKFNVTPNAIEAIAEKASGSLLAIDEGGQSGMTGSQYQSSVFNLAEGSGKHRLTAAATERRVRRWSTCITISEEIGFADKVKRDGRNAAAGAVARAWEIDVDDAEILPDKTIVAIDGVRSHYGHAGPAFVEHLIENGFAEERDKVRALIATAEGELITPNLSPQMRRVASAATILLVAGRLAVSASLLPPDYDLTGAVKRVLARSFSRMARDLDPVETALTNLRQSVLSRLGVDIREIDYDPDTSHRPVVAYFGYEEGHGHFTSSETAHAPVDRVYFVPEDRMMELGGGNVTAKAMARELKKQGFLSSPGKKNSLWPVLPLVGKIKNYRIQGAFFHEAVEPEIREAA